MVGRRAVLPVCYKIGTFNMTGNKQLFTFYYILWITLAFLVIVEEAQKLPFRETLEDSE